MATPELRHMLRDDDLNHEEQKQVLELAIKFHKNRFQYPYPLQLLHWRGRTRWLSAGH